MDKSVIEYATAFGNMFYIAGAIAYLLSVVVRWVSHAEAVERRQQFFLRVSMRFIFLSFISLGVHWAPQWRDVFVYGAAVAAVFWACGVCAGKVGKHLFLESEGWKFAGMGLVLLLAAGVLWIPEVGEMVRQALFWWR